MATAVSGRPVQSAHASRFVHLLDRYFYFGMSLLIFVLVTVAFSRTAPDNLIHPKIAPPRMLWLHGVVFYGWVLFFVLQSALVKIRKTRWHRTIGWFGVALGIAVFGLGLDHDRHAPFRIPDASPRPVRDHLYCSPSYGT